ncbi:MAG TPA: hypothetical protein VE172_05230 [Stackebrandtia sp.]|jgi:hypothetical protein|uniref:hypothetical protein n=1 Tax=Stackebrandtia sp. TaxID=2023065 RepID=UPI002D6C6C6B|nr:hypothetical protein [Stackebrandtia sp.]HZE38196.1 hypothetical protein [Stackebrandtia sp.]
MRKWMFVAGVAVGYVLGAKAGRERYEQIVSAARKVRDNRTVRGAVETVQQQAGNVAGSVRERFLRTSFGERWFGDGVVEVEVDDMRPEYWETAGVTTSARARQSHGDPAI